MSCLWGPSKVSNIAHEDKKEAKTKQRVDKEDGNAKEKNSQAKQKRNEFGRGFFSSLEDVGECHTTVGESLKVGLSRVALGLGSIALASVLAALINRI